MIKFSLIIPIYNVEKYIDACLNSVLERLPSDGSVEVILINDGSTDNSKKLVELFINNLSPNLKLCFKLISQENKGLSEARNTGIKLAKGNYLAFLDSDDLLLNQFFDDCINILEKFQPDIIQFKALKFMEANQFKEFLPSFKTDGFYQLDDDIWPILCTHSAWFAWLRIYKKEVFEGLRFPKGRNYEDAYTIPAVLLKAKTIYFLNKPFIGYRVNPNGITGTLSLKNIEDMEYAAFKILEYCNNREEFSISFFNLAQYCVRMSYKLEGYDKANERWQRLKAKMNQSKFNASYITKKGDKVFMNLGVYKFAMIEFVNKLVIKKLGSGLKSMLK